MNDARQKGGSWLDGKGWHFQFFYFYFREEIGCIFSKMKRYKMAAESLERHCVLNRKFSMILLHNINYIIINGYYDLNYYYLNYFNWFFSSLHCEIWSFKIFYYITFSMNLRMHNFFQIDFGTYYRCASIREVFGAPSEWETGEAEPPMIAVALTETESSSTSEHSPYN